MKPTSQRNSSTDKPGVILLVLSRVLGELLQQHLARTRRFRVLGLATTTNECIRRLNSIKAKILLAESAAFAADADRFLPLIHGRSPATRIVLLNAPVTKAVLELGTDRGIRGYVAQDASTMELIEAVCAVDAGQTYLSSGISRLVQEEYFGTRGTSRESSPVTLTAREAQVEREVQKGRRTKEIAAELSLSSRTIDKHRQNITRKQHFAGSHLVRV